MSNNIRLKLDANPRNAPGCVILKLVLNQAGRRAYGVQIGKHVHTPDILIQQDTDFPSVASLFGWSPKECKNMTQSCNHVHTDGTVRCQECGMTSLNFIVSARNWLDAHDGETCENPGYELNID